MKLQGDHDMIDFLDNCSDDELHIFTAHLITMQHMVDTVLRSVHNEAEDRGLTHELSDEELKEMFKYAIEDYRPMTRLSLSTIKKPGGINIVYNWEKLE